MKHAASICPAAGVSESDTWKIILNTISSHWVSLRKPITNLHSSLRHINCRILGRYPPRRNSCIGCCRSHQPHRDEADNRRRPALPAARILPALRDPAYEAIPIFKQSLGLRCICMVAAYAFDRPFILSSTLRPHPPYHNYSLAERTPKKIHAGGQLLE